MNVVKQLWIIMTMLSFFSSKGQMLDVGQTIPSFQLVNQNNDTVAIADLLGNGPLVIYFYPKDDTPGCTAEACSFRDSYAEFTDAGVTVIGISADSPESHAAFAEKYRLPFILLSDVGNEVRQLFGVSGDLFGLIPGRVTFVVDSNGVIRHVFDSQTRTSKHIEESLEAIRNIQSEE